MKVALVFVILIIITLIMAPAFIAERPRVGIRQKREPDDLTKTSSNKARNFLNNGGFSHYPIGENGNEEIYNEEFFGWVIR